MATSIQYDDDDDEQQQQQQQIRWGLNNPVKEIFINLIIKSFLFSSLCEFFLFFKTNLAMLVVSFIFGGSISP